MISRVFRENLYKCHKIEGRIDALHKMYRNADYDRQVRILRRTYVYTVFTANTSVEHADTAYALWLRGVPAHIAANRGGYHTNQKGSWIFDQLHGEGDKRPFEKAIQKPKRAIDDGDYALAARHAQRELDGLGSVKAPFFVALLTGHNACYDRHTNRFMDKAVEGVTYEEDNDDVGIKWSEIQEKANELLDSIPMDTNLFMKQWVAFDVENHLQAKDADIDDWEAIDISDFEIETHDLFYKSIAQL